jgi:hypothetical protein
MRALTQFVLLGLIGLGAAADNAHAAPAGLPNLPLDLELRAAKVADIFQLLGEVAKEKMELDPCVTGTIDLKLKNAPLPVVFDVLATKLDLRYETRAESIYVGCQKGSAPAAANGSDPHLERHLTLDVHDAPAHTVLDEVAKGAGLDGVDYRADESARVTVSVGNVRVSTLFEVIGDQTNLRISTVGNRLLVAGPAR